MKNLIFTSAGGNTNFDKIWLDKNRNYDVWVIFYGDDDKKFNEYKSKVDFIEKRKGDKWQNFHYVYNKYKEELKEYERFFLLDDDIIISTDDINEMFDISEKTKLWICQPSFGKGSRLGHLFNKHVPCSYLRYTNFVENNTPLMIRKSIDNFFKIYKPDEIDPHGTDFVFIWANGLDNVGDRYAVIDKIQCINPVNRIIDGKEVRDCLNINTLQKQVERWLVFGKKYNIPQWQPDSYKLIPDFQMAREYAKRDYSPNIDKPFDKEIEFIKSGKDKIAFLFLTRNNLTQPKLWYDFLSDGTDRCQIYSHTKEKERITQKYLLDSQIPEHVHTEWGNVSLVKAANLLIKNALKDPTNKYFVLVSDSCIPVRSFDIIYEVLTKMDKSFLYTEITPQGNRYNRRMDAFVQLKDPERLNVTLDTFTRNSQWMILNREHAEIIDKYNYEELYENFYIADEWYHYNVLQKHDPNILNNTIRNHKTTYFGYLPYSLVGVSEEIMSKFIDSKINDPIAHPNEIPNLKFILEAQSDGVCLFMRKASKDLDIEYKDLL